MKGKYITYPDIVKKRYIIYKNGDIYDKEKEEFINLNINKRGYLECNICLIRNGQKKIGTVLHHRLVAHAYIKNPEKYPMINHIDGNKQNNSIENLEWCDARHNNIHAIETGLRPIGEDATYSILTNKQVHEICKSLEDGMTTKELAKKYNVDRMVIQNIKNRSSWVRISKDYNFSTEKRITEETARKICEYLELRFTNKEIQKMLGVSKYIILNIRNGATWKEISCEFEFPRERPVMNSETAKKVCELIQSGYTNKEISKELGIGYDAVQKIRKRKSWKEISIEYNW